MQFNMCDLLSYVLISLWLIIIIILIHVFFILLLARSGPNEWRDARKPKEILDWFCTQRHLSAPLFYDNTVKIGSRVYALAEYGKV